MNLIVGLVFEYDGDDRKVETEIFIHSNNEKQNYARNQLRCICL